MKTIRTAQLPPAPNSEHDEVNNIIQQINAAFQKWNTIEQAQQIQPAEQWDRSQSNVAFEGWKTADELRKHAQELFTVMQEISGPLQQKSRQLSAWPNPENNNSFQGQPIDQAGTELPPQTTV